VGDIDDAKAMREPGDGDFSAADLLAELMHSGIVGLRRTILLGHLETGEGDWLGLIGYIDDPKEGRRGHVESHHILIGCPQDTPTTHLKRYGQRRVSRPGEGGAPVQP